MKVAFVDGDGWEGLYIDGKCVAQHHHVQLHEIFEHLGIECEFIYPDEDWLQERGSLPNQLRHVKRYKE